jgi:hypothetical protein
MADGGATLKLPCTRCEDEAWVCEGHPEVPWPHAIAPGLGCPVRRATRPPAAAAPGFVSLIRPVCGSAPTHGSPR